MKKFLILTLILPFICFSQDIIGTWVKTNENEIGIQFQENGKLELIDLKQPENKVLKNITINYKTLIDNNISYLEIEIFNQYNLIEKKKLKYLFKEGKLYLPSVFESKNTEKTLDYKDEYIKISKENYIDFLNKKEAEQLNKNQDNLGTLLSSIEFGVQAIDDELQEFEDGIIPWISIENPESQIDKLIDSDKIVIPYSEITLIIDYPLNKPTSFVLTSSKNGFTKKQLVLEISKKYHEIYLEEEATAKTKTIPIDKRGMLINRNETDGKYGIWGHDIGDLDLSYIEVYELENGKIQIILGVES